MMPIPWRRRQGARLGFVVKATAHGAGFSGKHGPLKGRNSGSAQATARRKTRYRIVMAPGEK
uniref:hypothetical protein n=1 Tax=Cupriavidus taiwanensis TaxID=164546 RepID=UPI0011C08194|nr:hypothetical protein [Cupriavidus taiwanensis]